MQTEFGIIPAPSEKQAMDWGLVLVSQGIESTIERSPQTQRWQLSVPRAEVQRAIQAIKQYHLENRGKRWVRELPWSGLLLDARAAILALAIIAVFFCDEMSGGAWQSAGVMSNRLVKTGEWWRLFTAMTLHGDVAHLALNATTGLLLVGMAMGACRAGLGLLGSYLAGLGGNVAGLLLYADRHQSLGASGIVMGALGLITAQSIGPWGLAVRELIVRALCGGFLLLVLLGLSPDPRTDLVAHVGGFATGLLIGAPLAWWGHRLGSRVDSGALILFGLLVTGTWFLALR